MQSQEHTEQASQSAVDSARWQYFPTPSIAVENATTRAGDPSYTGSSTVSTLRLQQPLWTGAVSLAFTPNYEAPADADANNTYDFTVRATDTAGNATDRAVQLAVTDVAESSTYTVGQSVIDLGIYGNLIAPVQVNGNWYYYWDRSGDGTCEGAGNGVDFTTHKVLDAIFTQDVNGIDSGGRNTDDTYRYATLNGVRVALPTRGDGTYDDVYLADNANYTDLAAIWDQANSGDGTAGIPTGWAASGYWSATRSTSTSIPEHAAMFTPSGIIGDVYDSYNEYVALQVLPAPVM